MRGGGQPDGCPLSTSDDGDVVLNVGHARRAPCCSSRNDSVMDRVDSSIETDIPALGTDLDRFWIEKP
jgi:hypothetical protein